MDRVIPAAGEIGTRLRLDPADARFLESALDRLPGDHEINSPVTMDLNGKVAVRAAASDQPDHITELVLSRSAYSGSPLCLQLNRNAAGAGAAAGLHRAGLHGPRHRPSCAGTRPGSTPSSPWAAARRRGRTPR